MAIQCKYCGTELPKDDARFCNNCGMLVPSHPFSPESLSAVKSGSKIPFASFAEEQPGERKRVVRDLEPVEREMVVPVQLAEPSVMQEEMLQEKLPETPKPDVPKRTVPPSRVAYKQISPLVSPRQIPGVRRKKLGAVQMSPVEPVWPEPVMHVLSKEPVAPEKEALEEPNKASSAPALSQSKAAREFHVAVWEDEEMRKLSNDEEQAIEDLPTRAVAVPSVEDLAIEDLAQQGAEAAVEDAPTQIVEESIEDVPTQAVDVHVDDLPTQLLTVPAESRAAVQEPVLERTPVSPFLAAQPAQRAQMVMQEQAAEDWRTRLSDVSGSANSAFPAAQSNATPFVSSANYQPASMPIGMMPQGKESVVATAPARQSRKRWPIVVVLLLLVVLVGGGVGAVLLLSQQSSADPLLQPQVSFSNPQLGIALSYPTGWIQQVEVAQSTARFYASNHVGEVDVIVTGSSGNIKQALQQQATKMGLSSIKATMALTFGGASWQQLRGTLQVSGANYTDMLLATSQGGKLFMIIQQAPQNNYADWDQEFFVPMRASFKFL